MKCKEYKCKGNVPQGKRLESSTARILGLCLYCYRMKVAPERQKTDAPAKQDRHLTPYEKLWHEEHAFEGMEQLLWSPGFYKEWRNYIKAKKRGELK